MNDAYTLTFDERPGYLYARVNAPTIDGETALAYLTEIAERANSIKADKLMIYRDIPAILDAAAIGEVIPKFTAMIQGVRTAIVNPHIANTPSMQSAVAVGLDRGEAYQAFSDISDAEAWLLS